MLDQVKAVELALLAGSRDYHRLREALAEMHPVDVARFVEDLPKKEAVMIFRLLPNDLATDVFAELPPEILAVIVEAATDAELSTLVEEMSVDDTVDILEDMPAGLVKRVLRTSSPETRTLINQYLRYPEDSAGSIMTAEYTDLHADMTAAEAIARIRRVCAERETIYNCYVIDGDRRLRGAVTLKDMLLAKDSEKISDLMETNVISTVTTEDRENAVSVMARYDLMAMPVVDGEGRLVGVITIDDAVDAMVEEATEDFERMNAMAPSERPYLRTGVLSLAKSRIAWLLFLMLSAMITGSVLGRYEAAFAALPMLVTFVPMLTGTGGNAGSQSSTMVIRGMALGEIELSDAPAIVMKELGASILIGIPLAALNFARVMIAGSANYAIALTVSLAMLATVAIANTIGGLLPIAAKMMKADPALMASPLITTLVDGVSLVIYFNAAEMLIGI